MELYTAAEAHYEEQGLTPPTRIPLIGEDGMVSYSLDVHPTTAPPDDDPLVRRRAKKIGDYVLSDLAMHVIVTDVLENTETLYIAQQEETDTYAVAAYALLHTDKQENGDIHLRKIDDANTTTRFLRAFQALTKEHVLIEQREELTDRETQQLAPELENDFDTIITALHIDRESLAKNGPFIHFELHDNLVARLRYFHDDTAPLSHRDTNAPSMLSLHLLKDTKPDCHVSFTYITTPAGRKISANLFSRNDKIETMRKQSLPHDDILDLAVILHELAANAVDGRIYQATEDEHLFAPLHQPTTGPQAVVELSDQSLAALKIMLSKAN